MLTSLVLGIARRLPRGGFPLVRLAARIDRGLRAYPMRLRFIPDWIVYGDLRESVWYGLWKHDGFYPHQVGEDRLFQRILLPGDCVWDIGANIGYTALLFAHVVGPQGEIRAFEPSRLTFPMMKRTVSVCPWVMAHHLAVSDHVGDVYFHDEKQLDRSGVTQDGRSGYRVESTTVDAFRARTGIRSPTVLKIDVEGHESAVLRGARELIAAERPLIVFEALNDDALQMNLKLLTEFSRGEYEFRRISHRGELILTDSSAPSDLSTNNYLATTERHRARLERTAPPD